MRETLLAKRKSMSPAKINKEHFFNFDSKNAFFQPKLNRGQSEQINEIPDHNNFRKQDFDQTTHVNGPPGNIKQAGGGAAATTPCPNSVSIGTLAAFNHSNLPASIKDNWGTYLGVASQMNVGPGPDHTGHCMKEALTTVSNNCPASMYQSGGSAISPCTGNRCLDINRYGQAGDANTGSLVSDGPTSFVDLHRTRSPNSLLEGTGTSSCSVVCEQIYSCDRTHPTTGRFRITRNFQADTHTKADGTPMHITTGNVQKTLVP